MFSGSEEFHDSVDHVNESEEVQGYQHDLRYIKLLDTLVPVVVIWSMADG